MGPTKYRGMGWNGGGGNSNAAPVAPGNGSGGAGPLGLTADGGPNLGPAKGEISDALAGRITLGVVNLTIVALLAFYIYTRSTQNGA